MGTIYKTKKGATRRHLLTPFLQSLRAFETWQPVRSRDIQSPSARRFSFGATFGLTESWHLHAKFAPRSGSSPRSESTNCLGLGH